MRRRNNAWLWLLPLLLSLAAPARAAAQQLSLHLESEEVYANLPFVLVVQAQGFEETPTPKLSKLTIPGCRITPLGVTPNVSSMTQIINGQRSDYRSVSFAFRFRIEASQPGQYTVPSLIAEQGGKRAQSPPAQFSVRGVDDSQDMQLRLSLPDRPLWVGETVDASIDWYLRRDVGNRTFSIPLFDQDEWVEIEAPAGDPKLGGFHAGSRQLELPYKQDKTTLDGTEYTRFRFQFRLTPSKAGLLSPPPARVVAELQAGYGRDLFGFQVPQTRLFQSVSKPLRLEIRPLPQAGRPESFKNAVGASFAIEVQAGRTVVRVGDPIELRILLRGKGRLAGLILPELSAMGLLPAQFGAPEEPPAGEVLDDGKGKLFRVTVRLRSAEVREIPALTFGYFDPAKGEYQTVRSQPIALSVKGSAVVGAGDVVDGATAGSRAPAPGKPKVDSASEPTLPLVGADLALSGEARTWRRAASLRDVLPAVLGLYAAAVGLLVVSVLRRRGQGARRQQAEVDQAMRQVRQQLDAAASEAARDAAPKLCAALRALRKQLGLPAQEGNALLERLETEAYGPGAAERPLAAALRQEVDQLLRSFGETARRRPGGKGAALVLLVASCLAGGRAHAQDSAAEQKLKQARAGYQESLAQTDRDRRRSGFAQAEALLRELATAHPDRPQLLADWGNAALLAQEPGRAVLAYRRALRLDPSLQQARRNLSFLREHQPEWLPRPRPSAVDALLVWPQVLSVPQQHVGLAAAVLAVAALLSLGLGAARHRRFYLLAASLPALVALSLLLSIASERDASKEAVLLVPGITLRSADSLGAPPAVGHPLPAGTELLVSEVRGDWTRVTLADGQTGWLASSAIEALTAN
jgi:hypothetical protein